MQEFLCLTPLIRGTNGGWVVELEYMAGTDEKSVHLMLSGPFYRVHRDVTFMLRTHNPRTLFRTASAFFASLKSSGVATTIREACSLFTTLLLIPLACLEFVQLWRA